MAETAGIYVVRAKAWARIWGLLRRAFIATYEDNQFNIAKGAAYSGLLAFFPVLTSTAALLLQANAPAITSVLSEFLVAVVPPGSKQLVRHEFTPHGQRPAGLLVAAALFSLWAASGMMISLMEGFQAAYRIPSSRPFLKQRGVAALLVLISAIPALGASLLILFGARMQSAALAEAGFGPDGEGARLGVILGFRLIRYAIALGTIAVVAGFLYFFGPNRPMGGKAVWPGALVATLLWTLATSGFAWYVRNIANYNVVYGSIGAVIALLIWIYLLAVIGLYGCELNAECERQAD